MKFHSSSNVSMRVPTDSDLTEQNTLKFRMTMKMNQVISGLMFSELQQATLKVQEALLRITTVKFLTQQAIMLLKFPKNLLTAM